MIVLKTRVVLAAALLPASTLASAQSSLPRAPGARVVTIEPPGKTGSEPSIAVNPFSPNQVLVAAYGAGGGWAGYSTDSARTFTAIALPGDGGDNSVTFDDKGDALVAMLRIEKLGSASYWGHNAHGNGVWVRRSPDGGKTWEEPIPVMAWPDGQPAPQMEDMERIWADNQPTSPYRGNLYMAWIDWQLNKSIVLFTRSTDRGKTWAKPWRISTHAGLPRDDNGAIVGIIGTVAPDGTQYVIWNDGLTIVLAVSHDGGKTFAPSRTIFAVNAPYFGGATGIPGVGRAMGFPQIAVDGKSGRLYVTWSDFRNGDVDVFISRSDDHGVTWTPAQRVNDDPIHNGADQFFQWMAVDPTDGAIYVQFYDRRDDPANEKTMVTLARSVDGGRTFTNYNWSDTPFVGQNAFLGDYMWLVAYDRRVYGAWAEAVAADSTSTRGTGGGPASSPTVIRVGTADFRGAR